MVNSTYSYILITPSRNEEAYIEKTIQSVISQTVLPKKWVIVSDGSTDRTDEIVKRYETEYDFIELLCRETDEERNFGSKVYAIRAGLERLNGIEYDFIGNLDADVSFEPDYYERVLARFRDNPKLGIGGGILFELCGGKWIQLQVSALWSVSGAIQMFRRQCYEDIGGYMPLRNGGVDAIAEVTARMHGWQVRSFSDMPVRHLRRIGTEKGHILFARFRQGIMEYCHRSHPLFEIAKCILRITEKPYVFGSIFRLSGYCWAFLRREQQDVPDDVVKFLRREQRCRMLGLLAKPKAMFESSTRKKWFNV